MEGSRFGANAGYGIEIKPIASTVRVLRGGQVLAESPNAKVMYETRLAPQIYIPREDILAPLSDETELQTFCPFKGTARYHDLLLDDETLYNGVWCYDDAMPESRTINGHIGFMPGAQV